MKAEALVDALGYTVAEVEALPQCGTLANVKTVPLVNSVPDRLLEIEVANKTNTQV